MPGTAKSAPKIMLPEGLERYIYESSGIYLILDEKSRIVFINEEGKSILGIRGEECHGKNWINNYIPRKERKKLSALFKSVFAGNLKNVRYFENDIISADGKIHRIEWKNTLLKDEKGKVEGIICYGTDVTIDRLAHKALVEGEERYRKLFNSISDCIMIYSINKSGFPGKILEVNETMCKKTGFSRDEIQKLGPANAVHPQDRKYVKAIHKKMEYRQGRISYKTKLMCRDGSYFPALVSLSNFKFQKLEMVIASARDLSGEIKTRDQLEQSEGRYRLLFESVGDLVAVVRAGAGGMNWQIAEVNGRVKETLGYTKEQFVGLKLKDIVDGGKSEFNLKMLKEVIKSGKVKVEIGLKSISGAVVIMEIRGYLVKSKGSLEFIAICRDITERKKEEELLNEQNRLNKGRALMLEKSAFETAGKNEMIEALIKTAAEAMGCSRAFWSEIAGGVNHFPVEWAAPGLKKVMGRFKIPHHNEYDEKYTAGIYNADILLSRAGKGLKAIMKTVLPVIKKKLGISEAMAVPCYINQKLAGTMVFCSEKDNFWTPAKQGFARDCAKITGMAVQKMNLEKSIRAGEENYRLLFENAGDPILVNKLEKGGTPSYFYEVNETAIHEYGYTKEMMLKMKPRDLIADYNDAHALQIIKILETTGHASFETVAKHFSGRLSPVEVNVHQFNINNEKRYLTTVRDISERKKMEKALLESEMYYKALTEESSDIILVVGKDGIIKYASQAFFKVLGYTRAEIEGQHISRFSQGYQKGRFTDIAEGLANGEIENAEHRAKTKDNRLVILDVTVKKMVDDPVVNGIVLNMRDITERKKQEDRMKKVIRELEHTNAELEQFAYVASHDLKEPLRMISNYLDLIQLRHKAELSGEVIEFMDYAMGGTKRMFELIQSLLTYSRIGRKKTEIAEVELNKIIDEIKADFFINVTGRLEHGNLPVIKGNKIEILQLFNNLIGNAVKFRSEKEVLIKVSAQSGEEDWTITVEDNGIGMERKYAERVFGLFERLHSDAEYPGTGIGLTICKKIVQNWGGRIWIDSEPGKGTRVHFTIPQRRETNE